ncbi:MAG TPA: DUF503 domain-containing protein [Thermoanaerobaculia bacterium]|nr:DUF503 domain-containing protein [Thermoanaerobaculia bacterium]
MLIGVATFELHLPHSRSLKEKRRVVKGVIDRLHARFRISIMESAMHDLHQRAEIGLAFVAGSDGQAERMLAELRRSVEASGEATLTIWDDRILEGVG